MKINTAPICRWSFTKQRQQETYQEKAKECGLGEFLIQTFDESGKEAKQAKVSAGLGGE